MEIIKNFGINPYLLGAQVINFLILFYLLKRFAFKPIMDMLEKRRMTIEKGLKDAMDSRHALENALDEERKILRKAQSEAQKIVMESKNSAEQLARDIKGQTKTQVEEMLMQANAKNARAEVEMEKRVAISAAQIAVKMVEVSIKDVFSEKEQKESLQKLAKNLKTQK